MVENSLGYSLHGMMNDFQEDDYWLMKETMLCSVDQINQHNIDEVVLDDNIASTSVSLFGYDSVDSFNFSPHATDSNNNRTTNIVESKKKSFKKVVHWSCDEHMRFLKGLVDGKDGKWKEISKDYVKTKTPPQVASHAQKYEKRQKQRLDDDSKNMKRKLRASIHDITTLDLLGSDDSYAWFFGDQVIEDDNNNNRSLSVTTFNQECDQDHEVVAST
ncbi:putative transcription factor MYB-HB-like family [Medicago truncatula]|uniref:MYB-like DNA-binding domain, shaqkyf class protein n=1 Tax=Medicago truncatula TaxID=3880 RepID=G7JAP1_MEDTR|nr:transcription factor SRM1 [Medicago truncatula]AES71105.2 MYB-like DNA-binding domain, shaqkyf class protein [Medicago truncatula]RHN68366.1 putative transcription factor MYB-HB-like family [Medicago truncatula]